MYSYCYQPNFPLLSPCRPSQVFEVFGPVSSPYYVLRFNSAEEISGKGLVVGSTVFYTPGHKEYTGYLLTKHLRK